MKNIKLAWDNQVDAATFAAYGTWEATLPLTNLLTRKYSRTARSVGLTSGATKFRVNLGSVKAVSTVLLLYTNLSAGATFRVKAFSDAYVTETYNSGVKDVFSAMFTPESGAYLWGIDPVWSGKPSEKILDRYKRHLQLLIGETKISQYWEVEIFDAANADGYVEFGRLFMGPEWTSAYNFDYGAAHGVRDLSATDLTLNGAFVYDENSKLRTFVVSLSYLEEAEAFQQAFEMDMQKGTTGEIFVIPDADNTVNALRWNFLAHVDELDPLTRRTHKMYGKSFRFTEIL